MARNRDLECSHGCDAARAAVPSRYGPPNDRVLGERWGSDGSGKDNDSAQCFDFRHWFLRRLSWRNPLTRRSFRSSNERDVYGSRAPGIFLSHLGHSRLKRPPRRLARHLPVAPKLCARKEEDVVRRRYLVWPEHSLSSLHITRLTRASRSPAHERRAPGIVLSMSMRFADGYASPARPRWLRSGRTRVLGISVRARIVARHFQAG